MISPWQIYDNELGRYTFRFNKIDGKLYVDVSFSNKKIASVRSWLHSVNNNKILPRQDNFFIPLTQDVQDYVNRLIKLKMFF